MPLDRLLSVVFMVASVVFMVASVACNANPSVPVATTVSAPPFPVTAGSVGLVPALSRPQDASVPVPGFPACMRAAETGLLQDGDAGFDPCTGDSNADGCSDLAEYYLGGCNDSRNALLTQQCGQLGARTEVSYRMPSEGGPWRSVWLQPPPVLGPQAALNARALEASPATAGTITEDAFSAVQPGARLRFEVQLKSQRPLMITHGTLHLVADAQAVAEGTLLITPPPACAKPH